MITRIDIGQDRPRGRVDRDFVSIDESRRKPKERMDRLSARLQCGDACWRNHHVSLRCMRGEIPEEHRFPRSSDARDQNGFVRLI